ncbi:uncharacterized protein LOC134264548 isoform X2 [Saccostrea cucullata]|uniref:uncharacterized protein LOC134264548 isoform X2 n=1 Tax=Saccostrea cuccullata TaxID=36930 RepID=UPI002ED5F431
MNRFFWPLIIWMCRAGEVKGMCTIKRYPASLDEWYNCVPCPPPGKFSMLCLHECVSNDCDFLSNLLKVCLPQYIRDYQPWFTDDIKCSEKQVCLDQHPLCESLKSDFKILNVSCEQTTESMTTTSQYLTMSTSSADRIITTQYLTTLGVSTTQVNVRQTTKRHVINDVKNVTINDVKYVTTSFTVSNDSILISTNTSNSIPLYPLKTENHSSNPGIAVAVVLLISLVFFASVIFARKAKQNYSVRIRAPLERQSSTSSRAPVIRTDDGYTILCFTIKRRITARKKGPLSLKDTPRGYYSAVQLDETQEFQKDKVEEEQKINSYDVICSVEDEKEKINSYDVICSVEEEEEKINSYDVICSDEEEKINSDDVVCQVEDDVIKSATHESEV